MSGVVVWFWGAGRVNRRSYWIAIAVLVLASWLSHTAAMTVAMSQPALVGYATVLMLGSQAVGAWVSVCLVSRRLHDAGRSGWWQIIPIVILTACIAAAEPAWAPRLGLGEGGAAAVFVCGLVIYLGFLAVAGVLPGQGSTLRPEVT